MTNPELRAEWLVDVKTMADRIITIRTQLKEGPIAQGNKDGFRGNKFSCFLLFRICSAGIGLVGRRTC